MHCPGDGPQTHALREGTRHRGLRSRVSLWGDGNVLKLTVVTVTRLREHTRDHGTVPVQWANSVCEL